MKNTLSAEEAWSSAAGVDGSSLNNQVFPTRLRLEALAQHLKGEWLPAAPGHSPSALQLLPSRLHLERPSLRSLNQRSPAKDPQPKIPS